MKTVSVTWAAVLLVVLAAHDASAQSSASSYVLSRVRIGQIVWVAAAEGGPLQGRVAAISDSQFEVSILGDVKVYRWPQIRTIEVRDPLKDGMILGGIIGGFALANIPSSRTAGSVAAYAALGVGLGFAAGGYGDHLREGRDQIYRNISPIHSIAPFLSPKTVALTAMLRW